MNSAAAPTHRLVFLDFDGTYADHGVVPAGHVQAVRAARAAGHLVFLCTGRPRSMVDHAVLAELDGFVAAAGGYVEIDGEVLLDRRFPAELATATVEVLDRHDVAYLLEAPEAVYGPPGVDTRLDRLFGGRLRPSGDAGAGRSGILANLRMVADLTTTSFGKVTYFDAPVPIAELLPQLGAGLGILPSSIPDMGDSAGEIHLLAVHKAVGLQRVAQHYGAERSQLIAIGDGLNDLEMLAHAGVGVAIEGSDPRVLAAADRVAPGPRQEGLVDAFAALGLFDAGS